jgi:SWI/SNF-related matrix-associated actin-dependent regulator of chromatin subfamily E protein 1
MKLWELGKIIGQMWRELDDDDKQEYIEDYESEKIEYNDAMKNYHNSAAYQAWVAAKLKAQQAALEDKEVTSKGPSTAPASTYNLKTDARFNIEHADEDDADQDDDGFLSTKNVAAARYLRNHRLINEIFSDSIVPDVRSVVTTNRMNVLKRQVQSLTMHQKKLEAELEQIEKKFDAKKQKILDSSEYFHQELKKHCGKAVNEETYQKMLDQAMEQVKRERVPQPASPMQTAPPEVAPAPEEPKAS